jgi:hypothetical protein
MYEVRCRCAQAYSRAADKYGSPENELSGMGEKLHARYCRLLLLGHLFSVILAESTAESMNTDRSAFMRQLLHGRKSSAPA